MQTHRRIALSILILFLLLPLCASAQFLKKSDLAFGVGLDYGGFGSRFTYHPTKRIGVFYSLGYNLDLFGYNLGAQLKFPSEKRTEWFISSMYGYNGVLVAKGESTSKTTYYGLSIGSGIKVKSKRNQNSFWCFEVLLPFRPKVMYDAIDSLKMIGYSVQEPYPVAISFGYHFVLKKEN